MPKIRLGEQPRKVQSIKLEPDVIKAIKLIYGGISNFVNLKVSKDSKIKKEVKKIRKKDNQ